MQFLNKHIFNQIITCALLVLICLSCPIKRGIKQDIGIPLSTKNQLAKNAVQTFCSDYRKTVNGQHRFIAAHIGTAGVLLMLPVFQVIENTAKLSNLNRKIDLGVKITLFILYRKILI